MDDKRVFPLTVKSTENISGPPEPDELRSIYLKNGKKPPHEMQLQIRAPRVPNHAHISVKLPNEQEFEDLGDLPIENGSIFLPIPLVFLSHASEDAETVKKINSDLRRSGILTWYDKDDLLPGDNWQRKLEESIESSDFVLVFLSAVSIHKKGTFQREIKYAFDQMMERPSSETYIIPVLLEDCKPPREFKDIHWSFAWEEGWLEKLITALRK